MLSRDSEDEMWSRFMFELLIRLQEVTLARWTQPSGPLCLWQCFYIIIWSFDQGRPDIIKQKIQEDFTRWWDWMKASFSHSHPQGWNLLPDNECGDNPTGSQVQCRFAKASAAELFSFQLQSLFGALGGGLSLYLGCAVVMIFEVIELLVDLFLAFVCGKVLDKLRKPISK